MRAKWKKNVSTRKRLFQLQPWVPELLQIVITDKLFGKNPWNFDTKNVKQYAIRGKKEKIIMLTMHSQKVPPLELESWNNLYSVSLAESFLSGIYRVWNHFIFFNNEDAETKEQKCDAFGEMTS